MGLTQETRIAQRAGGGHRAKMTAGQLPARAAAQPRFASHKTYGLDQNLRLIESTTGINN
jgi:hypothetical protein